MKNPMGASEPMQVCSYCGRDNAMTATHCRECGTELIRPFHGACLAPEPIEEEPQEPARPPVLMTPRRTTNHPVADNAIRMLTGDGWATPRDLVKTARRLKLMARDTVIETKEPGHSFCPRLRTQEDFLAAEKQVTDPVEFATALAFLPDHWIRPGTEIGKANLLLLEAEQYSQGDGRKADLVNRAIRCWDGDTGARAIETACAEAAKHLGTQVDGASVEQKVGRALCTIAEQVIADFGDSIEVPELELLNTLDSCRRLPEPRGVVAAGDAVILRQQERIDRFLVGGSEVGRSGKLSEQGFISEAEIDRLVQDCREAKAALALLKHRPALLHHLPENRLMHISTLSTSLAFQLGWNHGKWGKAAELVKGVKAENVDSTLDPSTLRLFHVSSHAIPLMASVARGENVLHQIEALNMTYPYYPSEIRAFQVRAQEILSRIPGSGVSAPRTSPESSLGAGRVILLVAVVLMSLTRACSHTERHSRYPTYLRPSPIRGYPAPPIPMRLSWSEVSGASRTALTLPR